MKVMKVVFHEEILEKGVIDCDNFLREKNADKSALHFVCEADGWVRVCIFSTYWRSQHLVQEGEKMIFQEMIIDSDLLPPPAGCISELTMLKLVAAAAHPETVIK